MEKELFDATPIKVFLICLLVILLGLNAKGETLDTNLPITAGNLTYNSVTISTALSAPLFSGTYRSKIMFQKQGDSTWTSGDTVLVGDTADIITSGAYGLNPATIYVSLIRFSWQGAATDTIRGGVTQFTTLAAPRHPVTTVLNIIPGIPISKMIIKRDGDQYPSAAVVRTGSSYQFQFPVTIGSGIKIDTVDLSTPNPNEAVSYYVKLLRNDALGLRDTIVAYGSFVTPALTSAKITATSVSSGTDSVFVSALISKGTQIGSVQFTLKDSTGVPIETSSVQSIASSGEYHYSSRSVSPGLLYLLQVKAWDALGLDTITKSIRTQFLPVIPGPLVSFTGSYRPDCGKLIGGGISATAATGDSASIMVVRKTGSGSVFYDTIYRVPFKVAGTFTVSNLSLPAAYANTTTYYKIVGRSKSGQWTESSVVSGKTLAGDSPDFVFDIVGMTSSATPTLSISGYAGCDSTTAHMVVTDSLGNTIMDTLIGTGMLDGTRLVTLRNFPSGYYSVAIRVTNSIGPSAEKVKTYRRMVTVTMVVNRRPDELDPETDVTVIDFLGQEIAKGVWGRYHEWMPMLKPVILLAVIDGTQYSWQAQRRL